jgi:hypothetical protein
MHFMIRNWKLRKRLYYIEFSVYYNRDQSILALNFNVYDQDSIKKRDKKNKQESNQAIHKEKSKDMKNWKQKLENSITIVLLFHYNLQLHTFSFKFSEIELLNFQLALIQRWQSSLLGELRETKSSSQVYNWDQSISSKKITYTLFFFLYFCVCCLCLSMSVYCSSSIRGLYRQLRGA